MNIKIAIIGRPNVGKSTIFNILSNNKKSIVYDFAGVTRDRIYGQAYCNSYEYTLIDTPGIDNVVHKNIKKQIEYQALLACAEADIIIFIVENGFLLSSDIEIANYIRKYSTQVIFIRNKADRKVHFENYYKLGFGQGLEFSAMHRIGIKDFKLLIEINILILLIQKLNIYENIIENDFINEDFSIKERDLINFLFKNKINYQIDNLENIKTKDITRIFQKVFNYYKDKESDNNLYKNNKFNSSIQSKNTKSNGTRFLGSIISEQDIVDNIDDDLEQDDNSISPLSVSSIKENSNYDHIRANNIEEYDNNNHIVNSNLNRDNLVNSNLNRDNLVNSNLNRDNHHSVNSSTNINVKEIKIPKIAIVGKPNSGKSTYINTLIQENRLITDDQAGTTRDSIEVKWKYKNKDLILIDTAGMRKKSKIFEDMENLSVFDSINSIKLSDVVILMIDAQNLIQHQDLEIMDIIAKNGKGLIIAINKCDLMTSKMHKLIEKTIETNIFQMTNVPVIYCSNFKKTNIEEVMKQAFYIFEKMNSKIPTSKLNNWLREAVINHMPPVIYKTKTRIKLKYITQVSNFPKVFKIFTNAKTEDIPSHYIKYLINDLAKKFKLFGISIKIKFHKNANPFV
ncbi:MAG: GTPase [Rickettsiales bacterium]